MHPLASYKKIACRDERRACELCEQVLSESHTRHFPYDFR
jgi:hypothetical protein